MSARFSLFGLIACCWACQNIEDAEPAERKTFIQIYEAGHSLYGVASEPTTDGYLILGNELLANGFQNTIVIRTNKRGERVGNNIVLEGGNAKALKVATDGYYIIGDSIKLNLESSDVSVFDLVINSVRLFKLNETGSVVKKIVIAGKDTANITDIYGSSVTLNNQNEVIVLGTFKPAGIGTTEKPFLVSLNPTTLDTLWVKTFEALDRDYVNAKAIHVTPTNKIIWASALLKENQNFSRSYLSIPYAVENSTFLNFDLYGENTDQQIYPNDIQPAKIAGFGYGVTGTFSSPTGVNGNIFFMRVDQSGNIVPGSLQYFDGELSVNNQAVNEGESGSEDTGNAITSTLDGGFVVAGSMLTTPNRGHGGKDIFLIKTDVQGNIIWNKIIGGAGDEIVSTIRETDTGDLLICGSNNVSGLSSIFLMVTDKNGELKN